MCHRCFESIQDNVSQLLPWRPGECKWSGTSEDSLLVAAQEVPDPNRPVVWAGGEFIICGRKTGQDKTSQNTARKNMWSNQKLQDGDGHGPNNSRCKDRESISTASARLWRFWDSYWSH